MHCLPALVDLFDPDSGYHSLVLDTISWHVPSLEFGMMVTVQPDFSSQEII